MLLTSTNAEPQKPSEVITRRHKWSLVAGDIARISRNVVIRRGSRRHDKRALGLNSPLHLGDRPITEITRPDIRDWHLRTAAQRQGPTRCEGCTVLRTIMHAAVADELNDANPVTIRGAAVAFRKHAIDPATRKERDTIVEEMPNRPRPMVLLATCAYCATAKLAEHACRRLRRPACARSWMAARGCCRGYPVGVDSPVDGRRAAARLREMTPHFSQIRQVTRPSPVGTAAWIEPFHGVGVPVAAAVGG